MPPCIAIALGDVTGIGPEVTLQALAEDLDQDDTRYVLLGDAGYEEITAEVVPWSHRPSREEFVAQHAALGVAGRRLAGMDQPHRAEFLRHMRSRLEHLTAEDFVDHSEVIAATAITAA